MIKERKIAKKLTARKSKALRGGGKPVILSIRYTTPEEAKKTHWHGDWHLGDS